MLGDCKGPIVFPPDHGLYAISATYASSGIGSLVLILNDLNLITLGDVGQLNAVSEADSAAEVTTWRLGSESESESGETIEKTEKFFGLTAW